MSAPIEGTWTGPAERVRRAPGQTALRLRDPWILTSLERPYSLGAGVIRLTTNRRLVVVAETASCALRLPVPVIAIPNMIVEVEPWQVRVYGHRLTPEQLLRFWHMYAERS